MYLFFDPVVDAVDASVFLTLSWKPSYYLLTGMAATMWDSVVDSLQFGSFKSTIIHQLYKNQCRLEPLLEAGVLYKANSLSKPDGHPFLLPFTIETTNPERRMKQQISKCPVV